MKFFFGHAIFPLHGSIYMAQIRRQAVFQFECFSSRGRDDKTLNEYIFTSIELSMQEKSNQIYFYCFPFVSYQNLQKHINQYL